jgi:phage terminase small subunit
MTTPKPPPGLKPRGRGLFKEITTIYRLDPGEIQLLIQACRTVDRIDAIDRTLAEEGLIVRGNRGQLPRSHPLLQTMHEAQRTLSRLIAELALPMPGEQFGRRRSPQQKAAAETRWTRQARLEAR